MDTGPYFGIDHDGRHPSPVSRRRFLQKSAMAVAGGVLFACTGGKTTPKVADPVAGVDTRWPIKRVIYVMLENRSFNNLFGKFPGVRGATVGVENGVEKRLIRCPEWLPGDLPHDLAAHRLSVNGGAMDGFGTGIYGSTYAYTIFDEDQIPNYWQWAREYALSENFFASAAGPSYPNHFYFVAGSSGGVADNPENIKIRQENGKNFKSWGCDAVGDDVFVFVTDPAGNLTKHGTCFEFPTVGEQLSDAGVDWAYYSAVPGQPGYFWNAYNGIANVFHTDLWHQHMRPVDRLLDDIDAGALPAVTWVTPRFQLSDHPPFSTGHAHNWVTQIVNKVMRSDMWEHTAIFLTWDEWGGPLRPHRPAGRGRSRPRHPRPVAHDLSLHTPRGDRRRARRVLDPVALRLGQLGAVAAHRQDQEHAQLRARVRLRDETEGSGARAGEGADFRDPVGLGHPP
jgi:phospholipase C